MHSFGIGKANRALRIAGALKLVPLAGMSVDIGLGAVDQLIFMNCMI